MRIYTTINKMTEIRTGAHNMKNIWHPVRIKIKVLKTSLERNLGSSRKRSNA